MKKSRTTSVCSSHSNPPRLPGVRSARRPKFSKAWLEAVRLSPFSLQASCSLAPTGCCTIKPSEVLTGETTKPNRREWKNTSPKLVLFGAGTPEGEKSYKLYGSLYLKDVTNYANYAADGCPGGEDTADVRFRKILYLQLNIGAYLSEFGSGAQMPVGNLRYLETWEDQELGIAVWGTSGDLPIAQLATGTVNLQVTREWVDHDNNVNTPTERRMMVCVDGGTPFGPTAFSVESGSSITTKTHPFKLKIDYIVDRGSPENEMKIIFRAGVKFDGQADWTYSNNAYFTLMILMAHAH